MVQGFQTPYPNIAAIKTEDTLHTPYQIVGYKDSKGNVHTAGRLL